MTNLREKKPWQGQLVSIKSYLKDICWLSFVRLQNKKRIFTNIIRYAVFSCSRIAHYVESDIKKYFLWEDDVYNEIEKWNKDFSQGNFTKLLGQVRKQKHFTDEIDPIKN